MAFSAEQQLAIKDIVAKAVEEDRAKQADTLKFSREMLIEQAKAKFRAPADKRGMGYLMEEEFDLKDLGAKLEKIMNEDTLSEVANNEEKFKEFGEFVIRYTNMRSRKNAKEIEAYHVANNSQYGWSTEKFYNQGDKFKTISEKNEPWYEKEELSIEKKLTKLRAAEKEAKLHKQDREREDQERRGVKRSRWGPSVSGQEPPAFQSGPAQQWSSFPGAAMGAAFPINQQLQFPPRSTVQCYGCGEIGHIQKNCPKKGK